MASLAAASRSGRASPQRDHTRRAELHWLALSDPGTRYAWSSEIKNRAGVCVPRTSCVCLLLQYLLQSCSHGEGDSGGHVRRETTSRGLCGLVCPSRTSERGGKGDCVKEGGGELPGEEGERERERALGVRLRHSRRC